MKKDGREGKIVSSQGIRENVNWDPIESLVEVTVCFNNDMSQLENFKPEELEYKPSPCPFCQTDDITKLHRVGDGIYCEVCGGQYSLKLQ